MRRISSQLLGCALTVTAVLGCGPSEDPNMGFPAIREVWDFSDHAGSKEKFETLAEEAQEAGDEIYRAEVLTQAARCHGLMGQFEEANAMLDSVAGLPGAQHPRVRVRLALERGRVLKSSGNSEAARPLFEEAWRTGRESGEDFLAVDAAHMVAIVAGLNEAEDWTARGREAALASDDASSRHWLGPLHNNLGWGYYGAERFEDALRQFEWSLQAYLEEPDQEVAQLIARYSIGKTLRALGRHREAVRTQEEARSAFTARGEEDGYVYEELAEGYLALGKQNESCEAAATAVRLLSADDWFVKNEAARLKRLDELSTNCD
jgi:tetratricopeptide (TPR) repeat protein